ncbi:cytochrome c biogenesis CcdA family protein [Collimonas pratensis]|uniref:Cytochrome C biogenesis transmembrane region family protein n=1 Tax=Collimonas pratensis TaxID=279113 RepID=A0A127QBY0_9BURK|nr:cytochrome c biogenesis CcdA family protein [Collimonas pratensis]AMP07579.1 cytochrome C biogenesis transmembrane region family protein [Collimonas pratensis]
MFNILLALMAGVFTIAAPCILPMLPILLGTSIGQTSRARPAFIALGFVVTFSACALVFSLFSDILGLSQQNLRDAAIALLLVFGVLMIWKRPFELLTLRLSGAINRVNGIGSRAESGNIGGLVLGMTLGAVWTPCAGPVLGSILTLVATSHNLGRATVLLLSYSIGAGIPMLAIAYGGQQASSRVRKVARYSSRMQQLFGVFIILTAAAMYYQYDTLITVWLSNFYPALQQSL